jgi:hypothetical protein
MLPTSLSPLSSLTARARAAVYQHASLIDEFLRPSLRSMRDELRRFDDEAGAALLENFRKSNYAWEMYFWGCLAERWINQCLSLEDALRKTSQDILDLCLLMDTDAED